MSLFGSFMGDDDIFNIFGPSMQTMRQMNSMMNSMFSDPCSPFEIMGQNALMPYGRGLHNNMPVSLFDPHFGRFGFNNGVMTPTGNCHSFMSQSVMTMSSGPDGQPQVYQETMSTRVAPGGIKETKKTVSDSRTGTRKMAIGHHIGERAHILERERNPQGEEERQEFINLDEEEAESFNREWESHTRRVAGAVEGATSATGASNVRAYPRPKQLALPSPTDLPASRHPNRSTRWVPSSRRAVRSLNSSKIKSTSPSSSVKSPEPATSPKAEASPTSPSTSGSRKREHKPDRQVSNKRHSVPASDN